VGSDTTTPKAMPAASAAATTYRRLSM
jgi:hypothetical protein